MPKRYNINPIKGFDLTEYQTNNGGGGGGTTSNGYWGSFYDTTTQTISSTTSEYPITLNSTSGSNGVAIGSPTSKVVFTYAGVYSITFSVQFENSAVLDDHHATIWLKKNGVNLADSASVTAVPRKQGGDNGQIITTVNYVLELQANDYLETYWRGDSTNLTLATISSASSPNRPLSPSIIWTAVQGGSFSQEVLTNHNFLNGLQGGTTNEYYHLTSAEKTVVQATSGTNTGDVTITDSSTIDLNLTGQNLTASVIQEGINHNNLQNVGINTHSQIDAALNRLATTSGTNTGDISVTDTTTIDFTLTGQALTGSVIQGGINHDNLQNVGVNSHSQIDAALNRLATTSGTNTGDQIVPNTKTQVTNEFLTSYDKPTANFGSSRPTWANIDKTTSSIADIASRSHTLLTDIGSRTHQDIDAALNRLATTSGTNTGNNTGDVTVIDTRSIDLTVSGQVLQANVIPSALTHNSFAEIQGGTIGQYFHLTNSELNTVKATSGTNTGDISVLDTRSIDLTVSGQLLQASVIPFALTHNSFSGLQGGTTGQYNHLTNSQLTAVSNLSGTNTGDVTVTDSATIDFTLTGQGLTGSVIQGGITHNNLGSLQGGTAGEYNHLTDAELAIVQATSGTNTGDQKMPVYGDGSDSIVSFDGYSPSSYYATFDGTQTYTLIRDVFASEITVSFGIIVITAGYRIFATDYIQNDGLIHNNGSNASGTTAGAGGLGGFFKAGGTGATGLLAASAGANGTAQATPTANTWVGGVGGAGAMGRASNTTFVGGQITTANVTTPANVDGGSRVTSNYVNYLNRYVVGATNWQMTPSIGGGSGAKSATGTTATSGAGGGGGGVVFVASPIISGTGLITSNGGNGGNASGTGGNFGGGGGGGGGVAITVSRVLTQSVYAGGGDGGTSVIGTNGTLPVALAQGTVTGTATTLTLTPTQILSKFKAYILTVHVQNAAGLGGVDGISGYGMNWSSITGSRVEFNTIASPTRYQESWIGYYIGNESDIVEDKNITITLDRTNTAVRVIVDEISNTTADTFTSPLTANSNTNRVDAALTLTVTLPNAPTAGNLVYSVFSRTVATAVAAGAGNTLVNSQTTAPILISQVSSAQQANAQTHTTTNGAIAGFSIELTKSSTGTTGSDGWVGKIINFNG